MQSASDELVEHAKKQPGQQPRVAKGVLAACGPGPRGGIPRIQKAHLYDYVSFDVFQ